MIEIYSQTWQDIQSHVSERMAELRARLEGPLKRKETTEVRAQLRELKLILALGTKSTSVEPEDVELPE